MLLRVDYNWKWLSTARGLNENIKCCARNFGGVYRSTPASYLGVSHGRQLCPPKVLAPPISWYSNRSNMFILSRCLCPLRLRQCSEGYFGLVAAIEPARGAVLVCRRRYGRNVVNGCRLTGIGDVPPITGTPSSYMVRQLWGFQSGERRGTAAATMQSATSQLTSTDMLVIAAYLASRPPD